MPCTCAVLECRSTDSKSKKKAVSTTHHHRFPTRDPELLKKWLVAVNRKDKIDPKTSFVCSKHFLPDCYERDLQNEMLGLPLRKRLKKGAIPTLFANREGAKDPGKVKGNKTRVLQKDWEQERKRIVEELLKEAEAAPKPTPSDIEVVSVAVASSLVFEKLRKLNSDVNGKKEGDEAGNQNQDQDCVEVAAEEPDYNELTRDDLLRIIDSMWGILTWWKNRRIAVLERRIKELEGKLGEQEEPQWKAPSSGGAPGMKKEEVIILEKLNPQDAKAKDKEEDILLCDKVQEKYITGIEESLVKFCNFNKVYLEILDESSRVPVVPTKGSREPVNPPKPVRKRTIWKCEKCDEIFPTRRKYNQHNRLMHPKGKRRDKNGKWRRMKAEDLVKKIDKSKWKCEICKELFDTIEAKLIHKRGFHNSTKQFKWKCNQCDEKYKSRKRLTIHAEEAHGDNSLSKWKCSQCEARFVSRRQLKIHVKMEHAVVVVNKWTCDDCDEAFPTLQAKHIHTREIHKMARRAVKKCPYCDKEIQGITQYEMHIRRHTGERPYRCDVCEYAAFSKKLLDEHLANYHDETPTVCMYCGRIFKNKISLKTHERIYHEAVSKYTCLICDKAVGNLKRHNEEVHQNIRRFLCHMCDMKYKKRSGLNYHLVKHHKLPKTNLSRSRYANLRAKSQARKVPENEEEITTAPLPKDAEAGVTGVVDVNPSESTSAVGEADTVHAGEDDKKISKDEEVAVRSSPRKKRKKN